MKKSASFSLFVSVVAGLWMPAGAEAQSAGFSRVFGWTSHEDLESPSGWEGRLQIGRIRLSYATLQDALSRRDIACGGFIIEPCPEEIVSVETTVRTVGIGYAIPFHNRSSISVAFVPAIRIGNATGTRRGIESDREITADDYVWGVEAGAEARIRPMPAVPLSLLVGLKPYLLTQLSPGEDDGFQPYGGWTGLDLEVGIWVGR